MRAKKWLLAAVGIAGFAFVGKASADTIEIGWSLNSGAINNIASTVVNGTMPLSTSFSGALDGFSVTVTTGASFNGANSFLINSTAAVTNVSDVGDTLHIWVTEDNYTLPVGSPLEVESGFTDTSPSVTTINQLNVYQAYADQNNNLYGISDFTNGLQSALTNSGSQHSTSDAEGLFNRTGDFSLTSEANIAGLAIGSTVSYTSQMTVDPAPLPASASTGLALLGGLAVVGGVSVLRRRRQIA